MSESEIKRQILTWLRYNQIFSWNVESVGIYDEKRGLYRKKFSAFQIKGVADIIGIYKKRPLAIEVKSKTGKLSFHQITFLHDFKAAGGIAFVARSVMDCELELKKY